VYDKNKKVPIFLQGVILFLWKCTI